MIHLTHTGPAAGQLICGNERQPEGDYVHAAWAPLKNAVFREKCCPDCLKTWALYAYDEGDEMPDWVKTERATT